jgi:Domain of unknown function (DUF6456)
MIADKNRSQDLPEWLPPDARTYVSHTGNGVSLRELARREGVHASTVLRRVRALENRRDDPLVDEALDRLSHPEKGPAEAAPEGRIGNRGPSMTAHLRTSRNLPDEETIQREARRVLRRLCEPGTHLVVAPDMERAVVLKGAVRMAVLDREVAQAFAIKDWIAVVRSGKVTIYEITSAGRSALRRQMSDGQRTADDHDGSPFADQHRTTELRSDDDGGGQRRTRYNLSESPLGVLARRREKDGTPFLTQDMVVAGERLREDFELAQLGPRIAQNWERFLTGADRGAFGPDAAGPAPGGSSAARDRVSAALRELGPGLGDMVLRCCCFLEGLEAAEQRLGWSARSGKIVLRIALTRLARHYQEAYGKYGPMIG